jgi:hypothetical protein
MESDNATIVILNDWSAGNPACVKKYVIQARSGAPVRHCML